MKNTKEMSYKLDIQLFADDPAPATDPQIQVPDSKPAQSKASYTQDQLDEIAEARATRASDAALKDFFKKQGMEEDEAKEALKSYKKQKQENQPNVESLNGELTKAQKAATQARIENKVTLQAITLGVEPKNILYLLKLADIKMPEEGEPTDEDIKVALEKVLEDVPAFKAQSELPRFAKSTSQNPAKKPTEEKAYLASKYKGNPYYKG